MTLEAQTRSSADLASTPLASQARAAGGSDGTLASLAEILDSGSRRPSRFSGRSDCSGGLAAPGSEKSGGPTPLIPPLIAEGLAALARGGERLGPRLMVTAASVDALIAKLERAVSKTLDSIIHHPEFKSLERLWRSVWFLVSSVDFSQNIIVEIVNLSKSELLGDFEDSPEISRSGMFRIAHVTEYGQFGGQPYGAFIGAFEVDHGAKDMRLLEYCSAVGAAVHAPFLTNVGPAFLGLSSFKALANIRALGSIFEEPRLAKYSALRSREDSRYLGLCLPGFLARLPWSQAREREGDLFYEESAGDERDLCWGYPAMALAERMADSFAKYRWCVNIIGDRGGGVVENLPRFGYESLGGAQARVSTECLMDEFTEHKLSKEGLIALVTRRGAENAGFFSANTPLRPKIFASLEGGEEASLNHLLSTRLPYMMLVNRLAHYLKVLQRENVGTWKERGTLESELNRWINQFVTEMDSPAPAIRGRRPLRRAKVEVREIGGRPGWYQVSLSVRPHFKHMGATFSLSVASRPERLDRLGE